MLPQAVEIEADLIGELDLLEQVPEPLGGGLQMIAIQQVGRVFGEGIKAQFHGKVLVACRLDVR